MTFCVGFSFKALLGSIETVSGGQNMYLVYENSRENGGRVVNLYQHLQRKNSLLCITVTI